MDFNNETGNPASLSRAPGIKAGSGKGACSLAYAASSFGHWNPAHGRFSGFGLEHPQPLDFSPGSGFGKGAESVLRFGMRSRSNLNRIPITAAKAVTSFGMSSFIVLLY